MFFYSEEAIKDIYVEEKSHTILIRLECGIAEAIKTNQGYVLKRLISKDCKN